jgi:multicomponent Na+:H+ antiporter subunit D
VIGLAFFTVSGWRQHLLSGTQYAVENKRFSCCWLGTSRKKALEPEKTWATCSGKEYLWGVLFFISAFSLAGLPPLSGFAGKFLVIKAGIEGGWTWVALIALFVGLFTLFSMVKIWMEVFWKPQPVESPETKPTMPYGIMLASSLILAIGIRGDGDLMQGRYLPIANRLQPICFIFRKNTFTLS